MSIFVLNDKHKVLVRVFNSLQRPYVASSIPFIESIISKIPICRDTRGLWGIYLSYSGSLDFGLLLFMLSHHLAHPPIKTQLSAGIVAVLCLPPQVCIYFPLLIWLWSLWHHLLKKNHFPASTTMSIMASPPALFPRQHEVFFYKKGLSLVFSQSPLLISGHLASTD